jgi:hypothetical protein
MSHLYRERVRISTGDTPFVPHGIARAYARHHRRRSGTSRSSRRSDERGTSWQHHRYARIMRVQRRTRDESTSVVHLGPQLLLLLLRMTMMMMMMMSVRTMLSSMDQTNVSAVVTGPDERRCPSSPTALLVKLSIVSGLLSIVHCLLSTVYCPLPTAN